MSHIKIQINSKEALERLLANDTEFEIEVRASVLHAYRAELEKEYKSAFDKELRNLINEENQRQIEAWFEIEVRPQLKDKYSHHMYFHGDKPQEFVPKSKLKTDLESAVKDVMAKISDEYCEKVRRYHYTFTDAIPKMLEGRFNDVADKGIKKLETILNNRLSILEDTNTLETKATAAAMKVIIEELNNVITSLKKDTDESNTK